MSFHNSWSDFLKNAPKEKSTYIGIAIICLVVWFIFRYYREIDILIRQTIISPSSSELIIFSIKSLLFDVGIGAGIYHILKKDKDV